MSKRIFNVNNTLYNDSIILSAISAFEWYIISYQGGTITIDDEDPQYVFDELMNYTLSLSLENPIWA